MLVRVKIDSKGAVCEVIPFAGFTWDTKELEEKLSLLKLLRVKASIQNIGLRYTDKIFYLRMKGEVDEVSMRG
jgi:hypothetical protein